MHAGKEPKKLAISDFIQNENYSDKEQFLSLIIDEIEDLQAKISYNEKINNSRLVVLKWVLRIISISLFISIILLFFYSFSISFFSSKSVPH